MTSRRPGTDSPIMTTEFSDAAMQEADAAIKATEAYQPSKGEKRLNALGKKDAYLKEIWSIPRNISTTDRQHLQGTRYRRFPAIHWFLSRRAMLLRKPWDS